MNIKPGDFAAAIRASFPSRANDGLRRRLRRIVAIDDSWDCAGRAVWALRRKIGLTYAGEAELKKLSEIIRSWEDVRHFDIETRAPGDFSPITSSNTKTAILNGPIAPATKAP